MKPSIFYFDIKHAIKLHDWIIDNSGGMPGQREIGLLDSALEHIQNDDYYPSFEEKLKHLIYAVNKFHPFNDGNKRSSLALAAYFLELNNYQYCVKKFIQEMEEIVVWLAEGKINDNLLLEIIDSIINENEFSESLKLNIIETLWMNNYDN
ncbi:MAG: type II toxin-antitoxin system death-on-curing family toxin [Gilliamella sp.]|nr:MULTISPECIES: type II toxin-antitoxin system death-on-curing family toxin [Gilliamella]MCO6540042.1 type II toxin-antitoxin system death-on-curing family toxin [Gilliamella sp.]NUE94918.1 type II toxin-antitoxin system death-on-curing family toxin [Gilliamella sp. ESL0232]OCG35895.1 death-on-curing protein [Gilliamella apicola]OCG50117.1 death-on-curing protein [Gilliamella apicola]OCG50966.1 death-on-curing protein [Gilliamella apicola]